MPSNVEQAFDVGAAIEAAMAGLNIPGTIATAVGAAVPPAVAAGLPIPTYRITVLGASITVGTSLLAGVLIDRAATLSTFAFTLTSLSGLGVGLTLNVSIRKASDGTSSNVLSLPVTPATLRQSTAFPANTTVAIGDEITISFVGVGVVVAGLFFGYIRTA